MQRASIEDLFDYTGWAWDRIGEALVPLGPEIITREMPNSPWPAIWDCLRHISFGYDVWASYLDGKPTVEPDAGSPDWASLNDYHQRARKRLRRYFDSLDDAALVTRRDVETVSGPGRYTPAQMAMNVVWHDRNHHGDINTFLYQLGVPDDKWPWIEYRVFVSAKKGITLE